MYISSRLRSPKGSMLVKSTEDWDCIFDDVQQKLREVQTIDRDGWECISRLD